MKQEEVRYETYNTDGDYQRPDRRLRHHEPGVQDGDRTVEARQGLEVGMLRPQTLFPFPEEAVCQAAAKKSCRMVLSIEMSMGQMVEDVERSVKGERPVQWYGKCGGDVPTPEEMCFESW